MEVVDVFDDTPFGASTDGDEVEHRQVPHELAQPDATRMRADPNPELRREQEDRDVLVHPADPGGVDLQDVEGASGEHLLEDDAIGDVLTGRNEHRGDPSADRGVAQDVIGAGRLLDPVGVELGELVDPVDGLGDLPSLVGVNGDRDVRADGSARDRHPSDVLFEVAADLELDEPKAVLDSLDGEPGQLLVVVAEPTRGGGVGGVSRAQELCGAGRAARLCPSEDAQGLIAGERIAEVAEVDQIDDLLGGQAREQLPQRLASTFGAQVPQGVEHRTRRHVHDALLGAEPPQLGVAGQLTTEVSEVRPASPRRRVRRPSC